MIIAIVYFHLPEPMGVDKARQVFEASAPSYQNIDGLQRKHYLVAEDGSSAGGVYLWDSKAQAEALYTQEWSDRLAARYGSAPMVRYYESPVQVDPYAVTLT
jgi:Putative mono-oxygenase ydhR